MDTRSVDARKNCHHLKSYKKLNRAGVYNFILEEEEFFNPWVCFPVWVNVGLVITSLVYLYDLAL